MPAISEREAVGAVVLAGRLREPGGELHVVERGAAGAWTSTIDAPDSVPDDEQSPPAQF